MLKFNDFATWFDIKVSDAIHENVPIICPECDGDLVIVIECSCCDSETESDCSFCDGEGKVMPSQITKARKWNNVFTEWHYQQDLYNTAKAVARARNTILQATLEDSNIEWEWMDSPLSSNPYIQIHGVKLC